MSEEKKLEVAEYYLTAPCYIQQVGDPEPRYINASPDKPVAVKLHTEVLRPGPQGSEGKWEQRKETVGLKRKHPKPPVDNHPGKNKSAKPGAHNAFGPVKQQ